MITRPQTVPAHLQSCLDGMGHWIMERASDSTTPRARREYLNAAVDFVQVVTKFAACPNDNLLEEMTRQLQEYRAAYMAERRRPTD